jgi:hypothetical protein
MTHVERERLLSALEEILKTETDPDRRKYARQRYLDLTNPETTEKAA